MVDDYEADPFAGDGTWEVQDEIPARSTGRFTAQILLLLVGIALFLWLVNVLSSNPILADAAEALSEGAWVALLLTLLVIDLIVVIILLRPKWVVRAANGAPIFDDDPLYMVGCPGCGTIFDRRHHEIDEPHEKRFQCPNCDRVGEIKSMRRRKMHVGDHWCTSCDQHYQVYQDRSECPTCHAQQSHAFS